jgi:hypothetical protein
VASWYCLVSDVAAEHTAIANSGIVAKHMSEQQWCQLVLLHHIPLYVDCLHQAVMKEFASVEMRRREIDTHKQAQKKRERDTVCMYCLC